MADPDKRRSGPVLIEMDNAAPSPESAPPVPDFNHPAPNGQAMQGVAALTAGRPSRLARWFWSLALSLIGVAISLAAWDFANRLIERAPILGLIVTALLVMLVAVLLLVALRELAGFARLRRMDRLQGEADVALAEDNLPKARAVIVQLDALYRHRPDAEWGRARLAERAGEQFDALGLMHLAERELLRPLDVQATREIEAAARQVALVTAVVPLALADVAVALSANLRMIRRIAQIYGGRSGALGSWRLIRVVMSHLVATGAVAVGDDMIGSLAGGGMLAKLSRRFGEGIVNGALTARVGVAAMEVCRPIPFSAQKRPSVTALVKRALTGLFGG